MVVEHHPPELQGLHMVLVEQQGFLEALGGCFKVAQFSKDRTTVMSTVQAGQQRQHWSAVLRACEACGRAYLLLPEHLTHSHRLHTT